MSNTGRVALSRLAAQDSNLEGKYRSAAYTRALSRLYLYAASPSIPILLEGESGTGKTSLARVIHERSPRASGPFHSVALSAVDDSLVSSELFGHVAGAYTDARGSRAGAFASASGGTLFLDEIGKASLVVQNRLVHAIEARGIQPVGSDRDVRVDVRIIAATSAPLQDLVNANRFLDDLYARLKVFRVRIPPLRERRADIPVLVTDIVARRASSCGYAQAPAVDDSLMEAFRDATWPHNLRELDATIHRLLIEAQGADPLTLALCRDELEWLQPRARRGAALTKQEVERALSESSNKSEAARKLGVDRTTLYRFGLRAKSDTPAPH